MSSQRLVFRNGFVVSMDPDIGDIPNGEVLVEDGVIVDVGPDLGVSDAEEIDATGMIVMPGFVDTHRHTWQTPVRGVLPCCTLDDYFAVMLGSVGGHYRPEDVHIGNYAGSLEALNGGVTTLLDWSHINNTPDHSDAAVQGLKDAGIRAVYAHGVPTGGEWWSFSELEHPEDIRRIRETYFSSDDGLLTLALAARAPGNSNFEVAKHDWELARELGIRISVHVGMRLTTVHVHHVKNMHDLGLLGPDTTYIHCTDSTDEELDLIAETGGTASLAPYVEMLMGHGPPPTGKLLDRGVRPSLSVDVVSSVPGEMFTQMRTALVHERIGAFTDTPDEAFAPTLTHRDVLEFATIDGARACALDDKVGSLTPKKQADIVLLNVNAINTAPMVDPDRDDRRLRRHVERRLGVRRRARREAQRTARRRRPRADLPEARRVEEPHPRGRRAPARLGSRAGGSGLVDLARPAPRGPGLLVHAREERTNGKRQRRRRRRHAGARPRARAVLRRRRPRRHRHRQGPVPRRDGRERDRRQHPWDRVRSRGAAHDRGALADVGDVDHLVLAAIERDANKVQRIRHRRRAPARDAEARRLHRGDPRAGAAASRRRQHPHVRRPRARPALSRLDDGHDRQRRRDDASCGRS